MYVSSQHYLHVWHSQGVGGFNDHFFVFLKLLFFTFIVYIIDLVHDLTRSPKGNECSPENKQVFLNSSLVSKKQNSIGQGQPTLQSMVDQILNSIKGFYSVANLQKKKKWRFKIPTEILSMIMSIQNLVEFCPFILNIWSKNQILASIKSRNSVANLRLTTIYNTNIDLVNDDVYTKFGLILSIRSQDIE